MQGKMGYAEDSGVSGRQGLGAAGFGKLGGGRKMLWITFLATASGTISVSECGRGTTALCSVARIAIPSSPLGPGLLLILDPAQFRIIVRHNGTVWEDFSSADQIWDMATWIQELSRYTTLHPGDVLWMGTQGADGDMVPGDTIEVEISDIGTLRNYVVTEE